MGKRILLIINPVAGKMKSKNALFNIVQTLCNHDCVPTIHITKRAGEATEVAQREAGNYDVIACCGGDGTLNEVINGVLASGKEADIGYIPAGTTNDFANSVGIPTTIKKAAELIATGEPRKIDVGMCRDKYFSYVASFGAFTAASYGASQAAKNVLGHFAYVLDGVNELTKIKPIELRFEVNGEKHAGEYCFGGITNSTSVGGIVKLKSDLVDMSDGLFEVVMVKMPKNIADLNAIVTAVTASKFEDCRMIDYFRTDSIKITFPENMSMTLDGEEFKCGGDIRIKNLKRKISIIK